MQKEILELHNLIKLKNIDKAYVEAKKLYKLNKKTKILLKFLLTFIFKRVILIVPSHSR